MNDGRRRRQAKQARRDARREKAHEPETPGEAPLLDEVRQALEHGHPLDLLGMASMLIEATRPNPLAFLKPDQQGDHIDLDALVESFIGVQVRETTALLTVFAELLDDEVLALQCRREVATRHDALPPWLVDLEDVDVTRAVRMTHVLGDGDEVLIGARLANGDELTCAAFIDHDLTSVVKDAFFVPGPLETVVSVALERNTDPDSSFVEMSLADARAWTQQGPHNPLFWAESDSWPGCRPLLRWIVRHMPEGGATYEAPEWDSDELSDAFFASEHGAAFDRSEYGDLLRALFVAARDPLRWSVPRVERALDAEDDNPLAAVGAPELLRAFIPFAHVQSGVRDELTAEALAAIDDMAD